MKIIIGEKFEDRSSLRREFMKLLFRVYMALLISKVYFPLTVAWGDNIKFNMPVFLLTPMQGFLHVYGDGDIKSVIYNFGGNLMLLAPMAFFLCYYYENIFFNKKEILVTSFLISLFIESTQVIVSLVFPNVIRFFEINDLICNTVGGLIGYYSYVLYKKRVVINIEDKQRVINIEDNNQIDLKDGLKDT